MDINPIEFIPWDLTEEILIGLGVAWLSRRPWGKKLLDKVRDKVSSSK